MLAQRVSGGRTAVSGEPRRGGIGEMAARYPFRLERVSKICWASEGWKPPTGRGPRRALRVAGWRWGSGFFRTRENSGSHLILGFSPGPKAVDFIA